jgi:hypothetical protein
MPGTYSMTNPYLYINSVMVTLDFIHKRNVIFTDVAFEKYRDNGDGTVCIQGYDQGEQDLSHYTLIAAQQWEGLNNEKFCAFRYK